MITATTSYLRIENDSLLGNKGRVFFVDSDGTETDISSVVRGITLTMSVDEITTAKLDVIKVKYALLAEEV